MHRLVRCARRATSTCCKRSQPPKLPSGSQFPYPIAKPHIQTNRMDNVSRKRRSEIMSRVRSTRNLTTEWRLRAALVRNGVTGWRLTPLELPGHPDFVFAKAKLAIFVDGCFWHGCPTCGRLPRTRKAFWRAKISGNSKRDRHHSRQLRLLGWKVIRIWEHALKADTCKVVRRIIAASRREKSVGSGTTKGKVNFHSRSESE